MKNRKLLSPIIAISIFVFILLLDLLTKEFIISNLIPNVGQSVDVIPNFVNFVYVKNTGSAWGMFAGRSVFLIVISLIILGLLVAFYILRLRKTGDKSSILLGISMGLIVGGCLGNLIDRIAFGYVRDFINFQFIEFPVFNFADVALTIGVIIMLIYFVFFYSKEDKLLKEGQEADKDEQVNISLSDVDQLESIDNEKKSVEEKNNDDTQEENNEG